MNITNGMMDNGFEGLFEAMKENISSQSATNKATTDMLKKITGDPFKVVSGAMGVGDMWGSVLKSGADTFLSSSNLFDNAVKEFSIATGVGINNNLDKINRDIRYTDTVPYGNNTSEILSRQRDAKVDLFLKEGGNLNDLNTKTASAESLGKLIEKSEQAKEEIKYQMVQGVKNEFEIKSSSSSHKIEFAWNGRVYNTYDLLDDPKFRDFVGSEIADKLKGVNLNGGTGTTPK
jgi:hypothetical protein